MPSNLFSLLEIGRLRSSLTALADAPRQGAEGAPDAWLEIEARYAAALQGVQVGDDVVIITWLHRADRAALQVHPRDDPSRPLTGVFATRSPDRPNPLGLHRVRVLEQLGMRLRIGKRIDDKAYQIRFTPRKPGSIWSAVNIAKFAALTEQDKVTQAGAAAYAHRTQEKSKVYAYEQAEDAELSAREIAELKRSGGAWQFLQETPPSYRRVVLHWVVGAKKPDTRAARFRKLLLACAAGERLR
jgi:tRNA (Thr-GGU) A37 N-methylase